MPFDMETLNSGPGGVRTITRAQGVPGNTDNAEFLAFLKEMALRRQPQQSGSLVGSGGSYANAGGGPQRQERGPMAGQEDALRRAQLQNELSKIQDESATRTMRKAPVNSPGQSSIYGLQYDFDLRGATPGQQRAVTPENAGISAAGAQDDAIRGRTDDEDWLSFMRDTQMRRQIAGGG